MSRYEWFGCVVAGIVLGVLLAFWLVYKVMALVFGALGSLVS